MPAVTQTQDRSKALATALSQIDKSFGKGSVMRLGDDTRPPVAVIPTGSTALDVALGIGGLPRGRVVEIYGPESSGKTTVALHAVASAQKAGGNAAFIDAEHALDPVYAKALGVDTDNLLVSQPDTGEQALEITDMLIRSGGLDIIVVDSVAALVPKAEIEGEMGDSHVGLQARLMSQALRKITGALSATGTTAIEPSERKRRDSGRGNETDWDEEGRGGRRRRGRKRRDRDRDRDGSQGEGNQGRGQQSREDEVLLPVAGILDVSDHQHAYLRTSGYLSGPKDVYVSAHQIKDNGLRPGDAITGWVREGGETSHPGGQSRGNRRQNRAGRQKYNPLVSVETINGMEPERARRRPEFTKLTPLYPQEQLRLETTPKAMTPRVIDLVAPIGKGQRGLIVSPPKAGKTIVLQQIANAISVNNPEAHLMVVLVDERPEEVTDMQRTVKGEVIASTFDRPASDHTTVAELAIERAKRLVELGQDVVVLLDSITRLGRAYNLAAPASGRILSGGVDASALYPPKRFFGAARNIENGGSLTILATALVETGSKMDEVIFEEFKGTGNMELRLSRQLAEKRIFPAVDVAASSTRREELLIDPAQLKIMWRLRRLFTGLEQQQALELVLGKLKDTQSNAEFLMVISKTTPAGTSLADSEE